MQTFYAGCPGIVHVDSVLVTAMPLASFEALELAGCEPLLVDFNDLSSGNGLSYNWTYSDNTDDSAASPSHLFLQDGTYDVRLEVTTSEGCSDDTLMTGLITVYPQPTASFIPSTLTSDILNPSFRFTNTSTDDSLWFWDFGDGNTTDIFEPAHEYADTGSYPVLLIVTSDKGCIDSVQLLLRVDPWFSFYVPNSFSPNGDGRNDTFGGYGTWIKAYEMEIYDRWGKAIFRTRDIERQWEGKSKEFVQNESYTYRIVVTDFFDKDHVYVGRVSVIH
jgi:gliding motility-associated-like protein